MANKEATGTFTIKKIVFYDEEEYQTFLEELREKYKNHIIKYNDLKKKGTGKLGLKTKDEKEHLKTLSMTINTEDSNNTTINGMGKRRAIFAIEKFLRDKLEEGRIIAYEERDTLRGIDGSLTDAELKAMHESFALICKNRLRDWKNGEFPNPREKGVHK